jgi:hypothetical protein
MPNYYTSLLEDKLSIAEGDKKTILKDIHRTRDCLENQRKFIFIENVLTAFAKRNPDIGYLQGFNFMVEFLWQKGFEEESAFWIFCHLTENLVLKKFYRNLTLLFVDVKLFKYVLYNKNKKFFRKLMENQIDLFFVIHKWFLVNFMNINNISVRRVFIKS